MLGVSTDTVKDYQPDDVDRADRAFDPHDCNIKEILSEGVNITEVIMSDYWPDDIAEAHEEEWTGAPPSESPFEADDTDELRLAADYSGMGPGEFIRRFFEDFEVGVKTKFVTIVRRNAIRREGIPDKEKMKSNLMNLGSGIGNSNEAQYIAEEYWAEAQNYLTESETTAIGRADDSSDSGADDGGYVSANNAGQHQGSWVQVPGQGYKYGRWEQEADGSMRFIPMQQPGTQQPPQPGMGAAPPQQAPPFQQPQRDDRISRVEDKIESLTESVARDRQQDGGMSEMRSHVEELKAISEMMDDFTGDVDGGNDEAVRALQRQLQQIRQELSDGGPEQAPDDPRDALLADLVSKQDMSVDQAMALAEKMGETDDPEVEKKRIEKDMELKKIEQQQDRAETLMDTLGDVFERVGEGIGRGISAEEPDDQQAQPQSQGQQPQAQAAARQPARGQQPPPADPAPEAAQNAAAAAQDVWACPECDAQTQQDPRVPGVECASCDYSIMQCPSCQQPVEIPPSGERTTHACPECESGIDTAHTDGETAACLSCDWTGQTDELGSEAVECDACDTTHLLTAADGGEDR
jgi:hypothetical protein